MMNDTSPPDIRWQQVMVGLLYPGVLGALIYDFAGHISKHLATTPFLALATGLAFFAVFSADFAHSADERVRRSYGAIEFAIDFVILILLFLAGKALLGAVIIALPFWCWLVFAKIANVAWEAKRDYTNMGELSSARIWANCKQDIALSIAYLFLGLFSIFGAPFIPYFVLAVLILDFMLYLKYTAS